MTFALLILGLILIFIEFYLPGAILGTIGSLLVVASMIVFASNSTSGLAITLYFIGVAVSIGLLIKFALWRIVNAKPDRSIYSNDNQEGFKASEYDHKAIGKKGVVVTDLKPGGYVTIEGKQHPAISVSGYVTKGSEVTVISGQEESLIVEEIKE